MRQIFDETTFETEIFKIADQVFSGHTERKLNYNIEGIEHDAFYETDFVVHCIEITVSRRAEKAAQDLDKLQKAIEYYNKIYKGKKTVRGWFITKEQLSPEQFAIQRRYSSAIQHEHYKEFHARLIDSVKFLQARENHRFGSIEPVSKLTKEQINSTAEDVYVDVPFLRSSTRDKTADSGIVSRWLSQETKKRVLILGDFGAGKSSFIKKVYDNLTKNHLHNKIVRFPIYLNLREFAELESPDEALRRHARRIGLNNFGEALIRAWKADYTFLLIDGFDEAVPRITAREAKRLRDLRHQALLIVRRLISESPVNTPIVLAGRSGFFQTEGELREALGVDESWERLEARDFDLTNIDDLKRNLTSNIDIPNWLPKRPLLITYYILWCKENKGGDIDDVPEEVGWLRLLEQFCEREISQIDNLPLVKEDILDIFGELSVSARKRHLKIGPISLVDLTAAYRHVMKDEPTGSSLGQLLRMPGLVGPNRLSATEEILRVENGVDGGHKNFLSYELVEAASARYLSKYVRSQNREIIQNWVGIKHSLTSFGHEVMNYILEKDNISASDIKSSMHTANNLNTANFSQIDILSYLSAYCDDISFSGATINIDDIETDALDISNTNINYQKIIINNSYIQRLEINIDMPYASRPSINNSIVEMACLDCDSSFPNAEEVVRQSFPRSSIEDVRFDVENDAKIDKLLERTNILLSILRKTYRQSVKGRMESALKSGVGNVRSELVDEIVELLERRKFLRKERVQSSTRWHPIKEKRVLVEDFLKKPTDAKAMSLLEP